MLMIRSGLPSGPLSGHLFVPPPRQPPWTPRSSLRRAPFTAFSCISTLKSSHPEGCVREKLRAQNSIRTEAFGEGWIAEWKKEEAALTGLEKGKLF